MGDRMQGKHPGTRFGLMLGAALALAGCQEGTQPFGFLKSAPKAAADGAAADVAPATSARLVERDVEAPQAFAVEEEGLWDGRPSLGGVWVAHPTVKDPERVIIRNTANGKFVIGALFRRERDNPGPKLQVSSDAAAALGMLAGAPAKLSVVALRREEAPAEGAAAPIVTDPVIAAPEPIAAQSLDDKGAKPPKPGAKPVPAPAKPAAGAAAAAPATPTAPAAKAPAGKIYVQIGIFSVEANAKRAAAQIEKAGAPAAVRTEQSQGKTFWRVVAGPASGASERDALLKKIQGLGYPDAYAVTK
ncbi:SPOR domain-containing protein [Paenirhodobacter ferrireducens]|nr:SPOR domain-containing protein [Sinirhodobacter ferrireducens]